MKKVTRSLVSRRSLLGSVFTLAIAVGLTLASWPQEAAAEAPCEKFARFIKHHEHRYMVITAELKSGKLSHAQAIAKYKQRNGLLRSLAKTYENQHTYNGGKGCPDKKPFYQSPIFNAQ